jgi:hypothetical protein
MMSSTSFTASAIPRSELEKVRTRGWDDFGNELELSIGGSETPLRCCLRDADPGEPVVLMAYQPTRRGGAYAEVGPVFVHANACEGFQQPVGWPEGFRGRRQLLRAYGHRGQQVHNRIVEPDEVDLAVIDLLQRPDVDVLHSRNVLAGCYMFSITRAPVHR